MFSPTDFDFIAPQDNDRATLQDKAATQVAAKVSADYRSQIEIDAAAAWEICKANLAKPRRTYEFRNGRFVEVK